MMDSKIFYIFYKCLTNNSASIASLTVRNFLMKNAERMDYAIAKTATSVHTEMY